MFSSSTAKRSSSTSPPACRSIRPRDGSLSLENHLDEPDLRLPALAAGGPPARSRYQRAACCCRAIPRRMQALPAGVRGRRWSRSAISRCWKACPRARAGMIDLPLIKISTRRSGLADARAIRPARRRARAGACSRTRTGATLVEFRPETGRTHQIRVHAAEGLGVAGGRRSGLWQRRRGDAAPRRGADACRARASRRSTAEAPLPDTFHRDRFGFGRSAGRSFPEDAIEESFLALDRAGRAECQQGRHRVQLRVDVFKLGLAPDVYQRLEDAGGIANDLGRRTGHHRAPLSHAGSQPRRCARAAGRADRSAASSARPSGARPSRARRPRRAASMPRRAEAR